MCLFLYAVESLFMLCILKMRLLLSLIFVFEDYPCAAYDRKHNCYYVDIHFIFALENILV